MFRDRNRLRITLDFFSDPSSHTVGCLLAALFLKQRVSLGQWLLIGIGFVGVLCVIQPGLDGLPAALSAVLGVMFLALRDSITRSISVSIPQSLCLWAFFALFSAGIFTIPFFGKFGVITTGDIGLLAISALAGVGHIFV